MDATILATMVEGKSVAPLTSKMSPSLNLIIQATQTDWRAVNDDVMGGISRGNFRQTNDALVFFGELSRENNGGFASIRTAVNLDLSSTSGISMEVIGDGRAYQFFMQTDARLQERFPINFTHRFSTLPGEPTVVAFSFADLEPRWRGQSLESYQFDAKKIEQVGFLIADGREGPFELRIGNVSTID